MIEYPILEKAKEKITEYFNSKEKNIYTIIDLGRILRINRKAWDLSSRISRQRFIEYMLIRTKLEKLSIKFPHTEYTRFTWSPRSIYSIVLSLKKGLHFTHQSAVYLHNLNDKTPKGVYATVEQSPKKTNYQLSQLNIDNAMSKSQRITRNVGKYGKFAVYLLNGKYTGNLGVIEEQSTANERIPVTDLEKTLIDITVRPEYAGDTFDVLEAYKRAAKDVSCEKLVSYLNKINYVYPYHQCIGFYMETSKAYTSSQIDRIRELNRDFDFYLSHEILNMEYSQRWKLFYPIEMTFL